MKHLKFIVLFITLFFAMALNMPDGFIARLGFEANYLLVGVASLLITWLSVHQNILAIAVIVVLAIGAGTPEESAISIGYDRDILLAALVAVVLMPLVRNFLDLE